MNRDESALAKEIVDALITDLIMRIGGVYEPAAAARVNEDLRRGWVKIVEEKL